MNSFQQIYETILAHIRIFEQKKQHAEESIDHFGSCPVPVRLCVGCRDGKKTIEPGIER